MPSIIGLSVVVHLGIIFIYRLFGYGDSTKHQRSVLLKPASTRRISLTIMASIFTIITVNAVLLIHTAVTDKHSSINFIEHTVQDLNKGAVSNQNNYYSTPNYII